MKFVNIVENGITKVILDLEAVSLLEVKPGLRYTVCVFEGTHDFDFTIINEFLSNQHATTLTYIARALIDMRRCIVNSGYDDPAADECVGKLRLIMHDAFDALPMSPTGSLYNDLYNFSAKYITPNRVKEPGLTAHSEMFITASLLSALCVMVIHEFETHFTDVDDPRRVLYPVFEEAIRNCGVADAKEFVEENRILVSNMDDDTASWVIGGLYTNDWMLRDHRPLPTDDYVMRTYVQRILSSKSYHSNKRMREMKEINKAEEQSRS